MKAQIRASEIELWARDANRSAGRKTNFNWPPSTRQTRPIIKSIDSPQQNPRKILNHDIPLADRFKIKYFKCDKLGQTYSKQSLCTKFSNTLIRQITAESEYNNGKSTTRVTCTRDKYLRIRCRLPGMVGMGTILVSTRAGINILKLGMTKKTANTEPKELFMGNNRHVTDEYLTSQIKDKTHIFHVVPDNFPLIEDGI